MFLSVNFAFTQLNLNSILILIDIDIGRTMPF